MLEPRFHHKGLDRYEHRALITCDIVGLGLSLLSLRRSGWFFLGGWLASGVQVPAIIYLAFFLRIF